MCPGWELAAKVAEVEDREVDKAYYLKSRISHKESIFSFYPNVWAADVLKFCVNAGALNLESVG